ncbi:hypothetical protein B5X24_HaOG203745 [Helicoverpa armigera]|nr:hypothetical protein B5X24_HaOG203745 [Helicoverpa armigera]
MIIYLVDDKGIEDEAKGIAEETHKGLLSQRKDLLGDQTCSDKKKNRPSARLTRAQIKDFFSSLVFILGIFRTEKPSEITRSLRVVKIQLKAGRNQKWGWRVDDERRRPVI